MVKRDLHKILFRKPEEFR